MIVVYRLTDLSVGEAEGRRDLVPVGGREVLLIQKPLLQLENLVVGERRPRLPLLLRRLLVGEGQLRLVQLCNGRRRKIFRFSRRINHSSVAKKWGQIIRQIECRTPEGRKEHEPAARIPLLHIILRRLLERVVHKTIAFPNNAVITAARGTIKCRSLTQLEWRGRSDDDCDGSSGDEGRK